MKSRLQLLAVLTTLLFVPSYANAFCVLGMGSCEPNVSDARAYFVNALARALRPPYSLTAFQKTNGVSGKFGGVQIYEMQFEAVVSFPDGKVNCRMFSCPDLAMYRRRADHNNLIIDGSVNFVKTERGWQAR